MVANILRNPKSRYRDNGLTFRHEIWHGDAIWHLWCVPQLKICNYKNPTWRRPPFWKIEKIAISRPQFQRFERNLAGWRSSPLVTVWSVTNLKSKVIQDGGGRHPKNLKIAISRQRFDWSDDAAFCQITMNTCQLHSVRLIVILLRDGSLIVSAHAQFVGRALCDVCRPETEVVRDAVQRTTCRRDHCESSK